MKFVWLFKKDGVTLEDRVFSDIEESEVQHLYVQTAEEIEDETTHEISYRNVDTDIIYYVSRIVGNETVWDEFSIGYEDVSNPCISGNLPDGITMRKIGLGLFEIHYTIVYYVSTGLLLVSVIATIILPFESVNKPLDIQYEEEKDGLIKNEIDLLIKGGNETNSKTNKK